MAQEKEQSQQDNFINERFLVALVRSAVFNAPLPQAPENLRWDYVLYKAKRHNVAGICYNVASTFQMPEKVASAWNQIYYMSVRKQALFDCEREEIFALFEQKGIDYMPLKGIIINGLYPTGCVREFTDNDILTRQKDLEEIREIMQSRGYEYAYSVNHDTYYKKPVYNFEFHHSLVTKLKKEKQYFNGAWDRAIKEDGHRFKMSDEDFYCYNLAHLEKHFNGAGAGIRSIIDIKLIYDYVTKNPDFDRAKVDEVLRATKLDEFEKHIFSIVDAFISDRLDDVKESELEFIFRSGVHGADSAKTKRTAQKKGKFGFFISRLFPNVEDMSYNYPILRKHPIFLPFCWIARIFKSIFSKKKRDKAIKQYKQAIKTEKEDFTDEF